MSDADRNLPETDQSITPVVGSVWAIVVPNPCRTCGAARGNYCIGPEGKMQDAVHTKRWLDHSNA